jgi:hypothetical protein
MKSNRLLRLSCGWGAWVLGAGTWVVGSAHADRTTEIQQALRQFDSNTPGYMRALPRKFNEQGAPVAAPLSRLSRRAIETGAYVTARDHSRGARCTQRGGARVCLRDVLPGRAAFDLGSDDPRNLVDNGDAMVRTLPQMEAQNLQRADLGNGEKAPWSDDYWAIYKGVLGARYSDPSLPSSEDWKVNFDYSMTGERTAAQIFATRNATAIDDLSPSEKYDLLVGDSNFTLTKAGWQEGQEYYENYHKVETWMGICHGWAPAAYMVQRPKAVVETLAADGVTRLKFYPSDIKALASLLWAKNDVDSNFVGGRCNDKRPKTDENGRVTSDVCFDTNPGTWHLAVVNQIGVSKRSFVMDATFDYEVWNQPVYGYQYTYFNPETREPAATLEQAKVPMANFTKDKFTKYRSAEAASVVGVAMDVTYVVETAPSHELRDDPSRDGHRRVRYLYDLELNAQGEIIGGEWYNNAHPDFLWTPPTEVRIRTAGDRYASGSWTPSSAAVPTPWRTAAVRSSRLGTPLAKVVEALVVESAISGR